MKKLNIATVSMAVGVVIWLFVIVLSYVHSVGWFHRAGYEGLLAHLGVWAFEGTFLFGTLVVVWSMFSGIKAGWRSTLFFYMGVVFNFYSNISSGLVKDDKQLVFAKIPSVIVDELIIDESVLIGVLISVLAIGAKLIVTDAIEKWRIIKGMHGQEKKEDSPETLETVLGILESHQTAPLKENDQLSPTGNKLAPNDLEDVAESVETALEPLENGELTEEEIYKIAFELYEIEGELPTRKAIMEETGCKEWDARKARSRVKTQIS